MTASALPPPSFEPPSSRSALGDAGVAARRRPADRGPTARRGPDHTGPPPNRPGATAPSSRPVPPPIPSAALALTVRAWPDPILDVLGHDPRSPYAERFWLPTLGPTACWLLRLLATHLDVTEAVPPLEAQALARRLGIGNGIGRTSPLQRTIDRCCRFGVVRRVGPDEIAVRRRLPALSASQLARLPRTLQQEHDAWMSEQRQRSDLPRHAARLARSLLERGTTVEEVRHQLRRWNVDAAVADRAVRAALGDA